MRSGKRSTRQAGFTLLEVLVATVIMAIAVTGLLSNLTTSLNNAARLTDYDRAAVLARRKMDELLASRTLPRNAVLSGVFDAAALAGVNAGWQARITPFEAAPGVRAGSMVLDRFDLEIWWMRGDDRRTLRLEAFRTGALLPQDVGPEGLPMGIVPPLPVIPSPVLAEPVR